MKVLVLLCNLDQSQFPSSSLSTGQESITLVNERLFSDGQRVDAAAPRNAFAQVSGEVILTLR
jgi:hypothetical protein